LPLSKRGEKRETVLFARKSKEEGNHRKPRKVKRHLSKTMSSKKRTLGKVAVRKEKGVKV